jgi:riboflavin kinase / FMN adenylyltransferase
LKIFRDLSTNITTGTVATIGIFDGVHLAHQQIINRLKELANDYGAESLLITLWPHPRYVLNKDSDSLKLLSTLDEKLQLLERFGLDNVVIIPFDKFFAATPFDRFIKRILVDRLRVKKLVVGYNHQFGRDRQGNYEHLKVYAERYGFGIEQLSMVEIERNRVSSSVIRKNILDGNLELGNSMLGHYLQLSGQVVHGNKIGRQLGFPTANIQVSELYKIVPADGVYAVKARINNMELKGMLNIGTRPTLNDYKDKVIEANFFNFEGELYEKNIVLSFLKRIREERKFKSTDELRSQINLDKQVIQKYFDQI